MSSAENIALVFGSGVGAVVRARMAYAFRVFAAIYGYRVVDADGGDAGIFCFYGAAVDARAAGRSVRVPARYVVREAGAPVDAVRAHEHAGEKFFFVSRD